MGLGRLLCNGILKQLWTKHFLTVQHLLILTDPAQSIAGRTRGKLCRPLFYVCTTWILSPCGPLPRTDIVQPGGGLGIGYPKQVCVSVCVSVCDVCVCVNVYMSMCAKSARRIVSSWDQLKICLEAARLW